MTERTGSARSRGAEASRDPVVSICIPTHNGSLWIREAIESALAQDFADLEVVVCDDASTDDTVEAARSFEDPRLRVVAHRDRVGMARNWNRGVMASSGTYIKFLMQDDRLDPACVGRMLDLMRGHPDVGMVFCARKLTFDEPDDPWSIDFRKRFGGVHSRLGSLAAVNDGRAVFAAMQRDRFRDNMIGEPTAVMVSRGALARVGLFNVELRQLADLEMWLRIAWFHRVGFIEEPLAAFRVHAASTSSANSRGGLAWLDRVWLLEGLWLHPAIREQLASRDGARIWLLTYANAGKRLVKGGPRRLRPRLRELGRYARFRLRRCDGEVLHEQLPS